MRPARRGDRGLAGLGQHLPVERTAGVAAELVGTPMAAGTVAAWTSRAAAGLEPFTAAVLLACSARSWCTPMRPGCSAIANAEAIDTAGMLPDFTGIVVHDGFAADACYRSATHAFNAHLLRELIAVVDSPTAHPATTGGMPVGWCWASQVIDALLALKAIIDIGALPSAEVLAAHRRLIVSAALVSASADTSPPGAVGRRHRALARRIPRRLDDYLRFAVDPQAPFNNNAAERDIRIVKIKQKVSGCMRTLTGAQDFAAMRAYLSTAANHGRQPLDLLTELTSGNVWIPVAS